MVGGFTEMKADHESFKSNCNSSSAYGKNQDTFVSRFSVFFVSIVGSDLSHRIFYIEDIKIILKE
jgi:hypothetical protein